MQATAHWMASVGDQFLPRGGNAKVAHLSHYTVQYQEWGEGPPLVLIPGMAGGINLLGPLAKVLAENFRVITYQLRGEDDCFAIRQPFGLDDMVDDLREFVDALCLENPTLIGVSFGGLVGLEYAARYSRHLHRLVVQGVGARFQPSIIQKIASTVLSRFPLPADNPFVNQFFNLLFGTNQKQDELFHFVTRQIWQTDQSVMSHRFQMVMKYDLVGRLNRIKVPTLILHGGRDILVNKRNTMDLQRGLPDARALTLAPCGHLGFVTHPELFAEKIRQFQPASLVEA